MRGDQFHARDVVRAGREIRALPARELVLELAVFLLELADALERVGHFRPHVFARAAHETRDFLHELIGVLDVVERAFGRDGLDAPHARGHAAFAQDLEDADVARARDVRAAAQLHREIAHAQHAHVFLVFLAEQRDGAFRHRRVVGHLAGFGGGVPADLGVHEPLDLLQLIGGDRLEVREVEAQPVGRDQRTFLLHVGAEHLAQRCMQ